MDDVTRPSNQRGLGYWDELATANRLPDTPPDGQDVASADRVYAVLLQPQVNVAFPPVIRLALVHLDGRSRRGRAFFGLTFRNEYNTMDPEAEFLPQHRAQRQATLQIISAAEAAGRVRVAEMNRQVAGNLDKIITALEDEEPDGTEAAAGAP